jgi:hypothetical protein
MQIISCLKPKKTLKNLLKIKRMRITFGRKFADYQLANTERNAEKFGQN